ncbi:Protein of unknown function DUF247, plant [Dillenia turbinata]|uniref:Uncharacterized protein n=1 Tax=Dillenia turbinata TaxID=194707 RepID=A0AAN8WAI7_9MAGN
MKGRQHTQDFPSMFPPQDPQECCVNVDYAGRKGHSFRKTCSTFRVPALPRDVDNEAYTPKMISIGPFHRHCVELKSMEAQKHRLLDQLFQREPRSATMKTLKSTDDFVWMMVLDGCFIVVILRLTEKRTNNKDEVNDPIFATHWMVPSIRHDLVMLENQLPLFVRQEVFDLTKTKDDRRSIDYLGLQFFQPIRPGDKTTFTREKVIPWHLLGLFQSRFVLRHETFSDNSRKSENPHKGWLNWAKLIREAGIKIKSKTGHLLDIVFEKNVLEIPTMFIYFNTGVVIRNLVAYEQSNRNVQPFFTCLVVFYNSLVDTCEDASFLREAGIIRHAQGSDQDVMKMINSLSRGVMMSRIVTISLMRWTKSTYSRWTKIRIKFVHNSAPPLDFLSVSLFYLALIFQPCNHEANSSIRNVRVLFLTFRYHCIFLYSRFTATLQVTRVSMRQSEMKKEGEKRKRLQKFPSLQA